MVADDKSALEFLYASAPELLESLEALMALGIEEGAVEAYLRHSLTKSSRDSKLFQLVAQALLTLAATRRDLAEGAETVTVMGLDAPHQPEE